MNFDSRILSFYHEIKEINKGLFPYPRYMSLYPTNACQFNCTFCDYKELNSYKRRELTKTEWTYIIDTFKKHGGEALDLCGGGEPLMLSTIEDLLRYIKKLGLSVGLVTNGLNIDKFKRPELYELLMDTCKYIRISFEAGSSEVFKSIKGRDCFRRILYNINNLIVDKPTGLQVSYKYTISSSFSLPDIEQAIKIADGVNFDSIQFKAVCNTEEKLPDKNRDWLEKYIKAINVNNVEVVCNLKRHKRSINDSHMCCPLRLLIDNCGDIFICCYYNHRIEEHKIGSLFEPKFTPFEKLWGSHGHQKKMKEIDHKKCNMYDCRFLRYNKKMKELIDTNELSFI